MTLNELKARTKAAIDLSEIPEGVIAKERDAVADYWAGSASQSYCKDVESGNVREAK